MIKRQYILIAGMLCLAACTSHHKDKVTDSKELVKNEVAASKKEFLPGDLLPNHSIVDINNNPVKLFEEGKTNLVIFWASWCIPCIREVPTLRKIYEEFVRKDSFGGQNENIPACRQAGG